MLVPGRGGGGATFGIWYLFSVYLVYMHGIRKYIQKRDSSWKTTL